MGIARAIRLGTEWRNIREIRTPPILSPVWVFHCRRTSDTLPSKNARVSSAACFLRATHIVRLGWLIAFQRVSKRGNQMPTMKLGNDSLALEHAHTTRTWEFVVNSWKYSIRADLACCACMYHTLSFRCFLTFLLFLNFKFFCLLLLCSSQTTPISGIYLSFLFSIAAYRLTISLSHPNSPSRGQKVAFQYRSRLSYRCQWCQCRWYQQRGRHYRRLRVWPGDHIVCTPDLAGSRYPKVMNHSSEFYLIDSAS